MPAIKKNTADAEVRSELAAILPERERVAKQLEALDRRMAELIRGSAVESRKPAKNTYRAKDFSTACGI